MLIQLAVDFPEENYKIIHDLKGFRLEVMPPGVLLYKIVDELSPDGPLHICETGCLRDPTPTAMMTDGWSSLFFAKYVHEHAGSKFTVIELDRTNLAYCWIFLGRFGHTDPEKLKLTNGESVATIEKMTEHPDVFYLDSCNGLDHGLAEFKAALAHNPKLIIMDDFTSKVASAYEYAREQHIPTCTMGRYTVFLTSDRAVELFHE